MNKIRILIFVPVLLILLFGCSSQDQIKAKDQRMEVPMTRKYSGLRLQATYTGRFINYEDPKINMPACYLIQINLINDTDSTVKFITQRAGPYINIVFDKKGYSLLGPDFISNSTRGDLIESGQIFSFPIIFYRNKNFDENDWGSLKIGFILLSWGKSYKIYEHLPELFFNWKKTYENVIWSDPIDLDIFKQKNLEYLRIINDTTFSYSKH
jgi:hypothetical protein